MFHFVDPGRVSPALHGMGRTMMDSIDEFIKDLNMEYAGPRVVSRSQLLVRDYVSRYRIPEDTVVRALPHSFRSHRGTDAVIWEDGKNILIERNRKTGIVTVTCCNSSIFAPYRMWRLGKLKRGGIDALQIHKKRRHLRRA
jgi:hypothetical protein